jgi:hypothetical protein
MLRPALFTTARWPSGGHSLRNLYWKRTERMIAAHTQRARNAVLRTRKHKGRREMAALSTLRYATGCARPGGGALAF